MPFDFQSDLTPVFAPEAKLALNRITARDGMLHHGVESGAVGWVDERAQLRQSAGQLIRRVSRHALDGSSVVDFSRARIPVEEHLTARADGGVVAIAPLDLLQFLLLSLADVAANRREKLDLVVLAGMREQHLQHGDFPPAPAQQRRLPTPRALCECRRHRLLGDNRVGPRRQDISDGNAFRRFLRAPAQHVAACLVHVKRAPLAVGHQHEVRR